VKDSIIIGDLVHARIRDSDTDQPREALGIVIKIQSNVWHGAGARAPGGPPTAWECDVMVDNRIYNILVGRRDIFQPTP